MGIRNSGLANWRSSSYPAFKLFLSILSTALLFSSLFFFAEAKASEVVLDDIKILPNGEKTTFNIGFGLPLEYLKHFPRDFGEILQIQLRLEETESRELHKEVREGSELLPPGGSQSVLVYVTYEEGVPGGPYLTLRFAHPVRFEVKPGIDRMSIAISIFDDKSDDEKAAEKNEEQKSVDQMMAKARQAITFGNNQGAIEILRKIIRIPGHQHTQEATELLGLALERDGQIPRAKFEYKKYLKRFPEGEGATRVKQRLAALRELRVQPKRRLRRTETKQAGKEQIVTFGRLTQAYSEYYVDRELDGLAEQLEQELQQRLLTTNFSVKSRYRSDERTIFGVFNANHTYDYLAGREGREDYDKSKTDVRRMYIELDDREYDVVGRIGRQSSRNGGVFGTYDGIDAGYRVTPRWLVSVMAGKPFIRTYFDTELYEKRFYGIKADVTTDDKQFSSNMFYVHQDVDGILDRQAIGGDIRYSIKGLSVFGLIDYDVAYKDLSLFNIRVGWSYTKSNKLNFSYNRRHLLMTSRALEGMSVTTIDELLKYIPEDEIRDIAEDRTRVDETLTIGNTYQINQDQQLNADVTVMRSSGSPGGTDPVKVANGDPFPEVFPVEPTDNQYIYSLQWISSNTFIERDLYVAGLRRSQYTRYIENSAFINARIPFSSAWRPGFRLSVSSRDSEAYGKRSTISPSVKLNYRISKAWSLDADIGVDIVRNELSPNEKRARGRVAYNYIF